MTAALRRAMRLTTPPATDDPNDMCVRTRSRTIDEFVSMFARYVKGNSIFVATLATRIPNTECGFTVALADGTSALRGRCVVREAWTTTENPFRIPGMLLGVRMLTVRSKRVFDRMRPERAELQAGATSSITPPPATASSPVPSMVRAAKSVTIPPPPARKRPLTIGEDLLLGPAAATIDSLPMPRARALTPWIAVPNSLLVQKSSPPARPKSVKRATRQRTTEVSGTITIDSAMPLADTTPAAVVDGTVAAAGDFRVEEATLEEATVVSDVAADDFANCTLSVVPRTKRRGRRAWWGAALLMLVAAAALGVARGWPYTELPPASARTYAPSRHVEGIPARATVRIDGTTYTVDIVLRPVVDGTIRRADSR